MEREESKQMAETSEKEIRELLQHLKDKELELKNSDKLLEKTEIQKEQLLRQVESEKSKVKR